MTMNVVVFQAVSIELENGCQSAQKAAKPTPAPQENNFIQRPLNDYSLKRMSEKE